MFYLFYLYLLVFFRNFKDRLLLVVILFFFLYIFLFIIGILFIWIRDFGWIFIYKKLC